MRVLVLAAALLASLAACDKANTEECDKGCRNYFALKYWEDQDKLIAAAPEDERAKMREEAELLEEKRLLQNLDLCVTKCKSGATSERANCWAKATSVAELEKCPKE